MMSISGRASAFTDASCTLTAPPIHPRCRPSRCVRLSRTRSTTAAPPAPGTLDGRRAQPVHRTGGAADRQPRKPSHVHLLLVHRRRHPAICLRPHRRLLRSDSPSTPPGRRYSTPGQSTCPAPQQVAHRARPRSVRFEAVVRQDLSLIHISEPTRRTHISYAVFCLKKKKNAAI